MFSRSYLFFLLALAIGASTLWVDTRSTWAGSGLCCWLILFSCVALGYLHPARAWLLSLAVSGWIVVLGLINGNLAALFAFVLGFGGAFVGAFARRLLRSAAR